MVDHNRAARGQGYDTGVSRLNLVFDLETRIKRHVFFIAFDLMQGVRHDITHELASLFIDVVGVDQDLTNVGGKIIANGADYETGFLIN